MKLKGCSRALVPLIAAALTLWGIHACFTAAVPPYNDSLGDINHTEKITGSYLLGQSAAREDNLIIYGSSELAMREISTHPSNFFAGKRCGFQVNIVGRGSCQALIHALSIAASGDSLTGKKVALITSPQSYVEQGIAPDMFMANLSARQYLELLAADDISGDVKRDVSERVSTLLDRYDAQSESAKSDPAIRWLAEHMSGPSLASSVRNAALSPYYAFSGYLLELEDMASSRALLKSAPVSLSPTLSSEIDWIEEESDAVRQAESATGNNDFGMLDDYYTTNIGTRLARFENRDAALDYSVSEEYADLRLLFEICRQKGIEPLFIHVPLHGEWSDYTGFSPERREEYYRNVREIAVEYEIETLDLTGSEYERYFLCDVMHLGWKGWLEVDSALIDYYHGG